MPYQRLRRSSVAACFVVVLVVTGCGASDRAPSVVGSSGAVDGDTDAGGVVVALAASVPTAKAGVTFTAETDPNHLLGRPGEYTSKAAFTDSRISPADAQASTAGDVDLGGGIEVFPKSGDAVKRAKYLAAVTQGTIFADEYDYTSSGVLLRVSGTLTPTQAASYADALGRALGADVSSAYVADG